MTDPQFSDAVIREQASELIASKHDHDPATCAECQERTAVEHERLERQQPRAPRDRALKYPRRDR